MRYHVPALVLILALISGCSNKEQAHHETQKEIAKKQWNAARAAVLASLAKDQYENGSFDKCRQTLDEAIKLDPENPGLWLQSAKLEIERGNLEPAERSLEKARGLAPKSGEADYLSGVVCQRWQKNQEAFEFYRSATEKQPTELAYLLAQAEMLVVLNRSDEALAMLQTKVIYFENSAVIRDACGQLLMQKGKYAQASDMFRQASVLVSDDMAIRERLAMAQYRNKEYREASETLARVLKDEKMRTRADLHMALGECYLQVNRSRDAREAFEFATQSAPQNAQAWLGLGKAGLQIGDLRRAEISLKRSLSIDSASSEANLLLGYIRLKQNNLSEAMASFKKASALEPSDTVSLCMVGYVLEKLGKGDEAVKCYAQALKIKPGDELATKLMAEVQLND
jgi:tetratricopeptide (TPR) repeat protein